MADTGNPSAGENNIQTNASDSTAQEQQQAAAATATNGVIAKVPTPTVCLKCGLAITDQWVPLQTGVCHPQCFCCEDCGTNVEDNYCLLEDADSPKQSHLLCERHYFERTNFVCAKCRQPLDSTYVHALGRKYHPEHFTCTECQTIFGPDGTYYEHDGEPYCLHHYTYLVAKRCAGCQQPIMKLFLQINNRGIDEHWHPECYMIYKFWNVRIYPTIYDGVRGRVPKQIAKPQNAVSEQQIYQVWTVLSSFEESTATCISDMLLQVSGGHYLDGLRQAERFIMHVDVLFGSIDDLEDELSHFDDSTGLQHTREPKLLCKRIVSFFSVLSHTQSNESNGLTQELLSLITSLAHYLKVLTRVALKGALKAQTEYECPSSIMALLSRLMETSDRHKWAMFRLSYQQTDIASDCCASCRSEVETECIEYTRRTKRWHLYCFVCSSCNCEIQHMYPQSAHDDKTGQLYCPDCAARKGLQPGGFKFVSQLEQYSFLMRVALKRLYSLLKMKSALENPDMMRHRKAGKNRAIAAVSDRSEASKSPEGSHASSEKDLVERQAAANNEFDAALASMDMSAPTSLQASSEQRTLQEAERELQVATSIGQAQSLNLTDTTSPLSPEVATAVADAAVKAARQEGGIVQMRETDNSLSPPQVLADRRKTRVAHTTVYTVKARLENSQQDGYADMPGQSSQTTLQAYHQTSPQMQQTMRRAGHIATPVGMSVNALAAQAGSGSSAGAVASKPSKLRRTSDENDQSAAHAATNAAEAATRVKTMLSRPHTMRFLSDLNTAELFCAKHVAVARLSALLCATEFSQADLVALIGTPKKQTPVGMWSRLKTNLKKKDVAGSSANGGDKERLRTATFGVSLETLMDRQSVETEMGAHGKQKLAIPQFFEVMLNTLSSMDLAVEGIFRKNGNIRRLREVTEAVDKDYSRVDLKKDTPVQIAALLKKFLRELPDPLVPFRMRRLFLGIASISSMRERLEAFRYAIILMPQPNRDMLNVLITFLNWVATFSHVDDKAGSKMDSLNLATVITPNILYADVKEPTRNDRDDTFSYEACNVIHQLMEAGEPLWMLPDAVIQFLRDNASGLGEDVADLNTKELLRRCERQAQQAASNGVASGGSGLGSGGGGSGPVVTITNPEL